MRYVILALTVVLLLLAGVFRGFSDAPAVSATSVAAISAGSHHTCALSTAGGVKCWGDNRFGQLGDGTNTGPDQCGGPQDACGTTPVEVMGLSTGVVAISAGGEHTCALTIGGGVKCWGENEYGQLGDGTSSGPEQCGPSLYACGTIPENVAGLTSGVVAISAGGDGDGVDHTCALTTSGVVKCWGVNDGGELGDGTSTGPEQCSPSPPRLAFSCSTTPVEVMGLSTGVVAISAGGYHTCSLTTAGGVKCWGTNFNGQLGDGTNAGRPGVCGGVACSTTPVDVTGLISGVVAVSGGGLHTCALTTSGGTKCWGDNELGEVGAGTTGDPSCSCLTTPVGVSGLTSGVAAITAGGDDACALTTDGGVKCWGGNEVGQLGDGTSTGPEECNLRARQISCSTTPVDVVGLTSGVAAISAGGGHTCALTTEGGVKCWGDDEAGDLGDGTFAFAHAVPVDVLFDTSVATPSPTMPSPTASSHASSSPTAAALPKTGGPPDASGDSAFLDLLIGLGVLGVAGAGVIAVRLRRTVEPVRCRGQ